MRLEGPHLLDLEDLIRDVLATPAAEVDSELVALVRGAMRVQPQFSVSVVLRAQRLEQKLRKAQQEIIRLQWELAQLRRGLKAKPAEDAGRE
jgi:hypothetical protein